VKRQKLLKEITKRGAVFVRHGTKHDIYENRRTNTSTQVPRHADINELVAKAIIKFFSNTGI
jgi:predicted RNA binding protein YcfA (HicA-like mRNA interferase family)